MANDINEVGYKHRKTGTVTFVPSSDSIEVVDCGDSDCGHLHLFLLDAMGQPIAEATVSREFCIELMGFWTNR